MSAFHLDEVVGFAGSISYDSGKPDGVPPKLLDISRLMGLRWQPNYNLREGPTHKYQCLVENCAQIGKQGKQRNE